MPIWDIYSKRGKPSPDVYQFETLPAPLRVQIQRSSEMLTSTTATVDTRRPNAGCLKALESTLKVICHRRGWQFDGEKHTAKALIEIVFKDGLIRDYLQSEFVALRSVLESGVPTIRNRAGGRGAGVKRREVPGYLASYTLHLTAAAILFLAEAEAAASNEPRQLPLSWLIQSPSGCHRRLPTPPWSRPLAGIGARSPRSIRRLARIRP